MPAVPAAHRRARRRFIASLASLLAVRGSSAQATASSPPVTLIVPAAPGTSSDRLGRIVADGLSAILETTVRVENVVGDAGVTGTNALAAGARDGTVVGLAVSSAVIGGKFLSRAAKFNPVDDFQWLAILGTYPAALVIAGSSPHRSVEAWVAAAREAPSPWVYASVGTGSAGHLAGGYLRVEQRANLVHRSVELPDERYSHLGEGTIEALFDGTPSAMIEAPRAGHRIIAVTSAGRQAALGDVPSFGELWQRSFDVWIGLATPKGVESPAYTRLAAAVGVLMNAPQHAGRMRAAGMSFMGLSGREALAFLESDILRSARLIATLNQDGQRN
jgi:tripartite-type tricarboxylate transporter receptor subunit TctC